MGSGMATAQALQRIFDFTSPDRASKRRIAVLAVLCFLALC